jgi:hypothetical protein
MSVERKVSRFHVWSAAELGSSANSKGAPSWLPCILVETCLCQYLPLPPPRLSPRSLPSPRLPRPGRRSRAFAGPGLATWRSPPSRTAACPSAPIRRLWSRQSRPRPSRTRWRRMSAPLPSTPEVASSSSKRADRRPNYRNLAGEAARHGGRRPHPVLGSHLPFPGHGHVLKSGTAFTYDAVFRNHLA